MMPFMYGAAVPVPLSSEYQPDYTLDDWSRQMPAATNSRRLSRGSNGQRSGGAMRIVKPTSASNSPRSSMLASRRRMVVNDGMGMQARIRQHLMDQAIMSAALAEPSYDFSDPITRSSRPVSWHPGTPLQQQQQHGFTEPTTIPSPACYATDQLATSAQYSPVPATYSCHTSPVAFSPLSLPFADYRQSTQYLPFDDSWNLSTQVVPMVGSQADQQPVDMATYMPEHSCAPHTTSAEEIDWNTFTTHEFNNTMSPPTPDTFTPMPQTEPAVTSEESIPYQPLEDEEEEEGEILIGMGLYDTPGKEFADTGLDNYRTTTSHLLGTATGKGLKLLEAWEPPASDDEEDENEEDEEEDGEAEDE